MSNIYLKVTIVKNWRARNFNFLSLKHSSRGQFLGHSNWRISLYLKTSCSNLKIRGLGAKAWMAFLLFSFWKELWGFKVKKSTLFVEQKLKAKRNEKWKIPHTLSERWTLRFSSYKNHVLEVKLWWVGARERKESAFFVTFSLPYLTFVFYLHV